MAPSSGSGQAPPPYAARPDPDQPDISQHFATLEVNELAAHTSVPNTSKAICHLKLLHAIHTLRQNVSDQVGLFGLEDVATDGKPNEARDILQQRIKEKRWSVYVVRAAERFRLWWESLRVQKRATWLTFGQLGAGDPIKKLEATQPNWDLTLPPLDVLMVCCYSAAPRCTPHL